MKNKMIHIIFREYNSYGNLTAWEVEAVFEDLKEAQLVYDELYAYGGGYCHEFRLSSYKVDGRFLSLNKNAHAMTALGLSSSKK